jgi:hypothetical protein
VVSILMAAQANKQVIDRLDSCDVAGFRLVTARSATLGR